jgi:hypothetical protein
MGSSLAQIFAQFTIGSRFGRASVIWPESRELIAINQARPSVKDDKRRNRATPDRISFT